MTVENIDLNSYLPIFIEETKDNIQLISSNLLRLEHNADDVEAINEIFRAAHTLKGMSATMGYTEISQLAHQAENLLDEVRQNNARINSEMITGFFHFVDEFEAQLQSLVETGAPRKNSTRALSGDSRSFFPGAGSSHRNSLGGSRGGPVLSPGNIF